MAGGTGWLLPGGPGGGASALDDLTDVDLTAIAPADGDALVFDSASGLWAPAAVAGGGGGASGLLATKSYSPATRVDTSATGTPAALDTTNLRVGFTVPSSGQVVLVLSGWVYGPQFTVLNWCVLSAGVRVAASDAAVRYHEPAGIVHGRISHRSLIPGLTPGASLSWDFAHYRSFGAGNVVTAYGGDVTTGAPGPALMEVWTA